MTATKWPRLLAGISAALATPAFASTAAAQETTYIDCTIVNDDGRTQRTPFAIAGNDIRVWTGEGWAANCARFLICTVTDHLITVKDGDDGLVRIDRLTGDYYSGTRAPDGQWRQIANGKCVRGQDPETKPHAF